VNENANVGHGWVHPRPDGMRARCGGPRLCPRCAVEAQQTIAPSEREALAQHLKILGPLVERMTAEQAFSFGVVCGLASRAAKGKP
jgi:hypothetical protein